MRYEELLGTEVRNPQDELLGSITDLVRNPQTDKMAYLVIAPDKNIGIDDKNVPVPVEDFKLTPNANLLVLEASKPALAAAPRVNPFSSDEIELPAGRWMPTGRTTSRIETQTPFKIVGTSSSEYR